MSRYRFRGKQTEKVFNVIKEAGKPISLRDIRVSIDVNYNTIRSTVQRLSKLGLIERVDRGIYKCIEK